MNIGNTIQNLRKKKGLNQTEFAEMVGITQTALSKLEAGKTRPQPENLNKICDALEISEVLLYFLSFDESDVPEEKREFYNQSAGTIKDLAMKLLKVDNNI